MKRFFALFLAVITVMTLSACVYFEPSPTEEPEFFPTDFSTPDPNATQSSETSDPSASQPAETSAPAPAMAFDNRNLNGTSGTQGTTLYFYGKNEVFDSSGCFFITSADGLIYYGETSYGTRTFTHCFDPATGESHVVCAKPHCQHLGYECPAYNSFCPQYYNGKIYYQQYYSVGSLRVNSAIFRMNPDGSEAELVRMLISSDSDPEANEDNGFFMIHQGKMYTYNSVAYTGYNDINLNDRHIVFMELQGREGKHRVLFNEAYTYTARARVFMYSNYAFVLVCDKIMEKDSDGNTVWRNVVELNAVELETGECSKIFYDENAPAAFERSCYVERNGTIWYAVHSYDYSEESGMDFHPVRVYKSNKGRIELAAEMTDGDMDYIYPIMSNNIYGAFTRNDDGTADIWLCDFKGNTLYKGSIDIDFSDMLSEYYPDSSWKLLWELGAWGDETCIFLRFSAHEENEYSSDDWFSDRGTVVAFIAKYDITPEGLVRTFLPLGKD